MVKQIASVNEQGFDWIDLTAPTKDEITEIADKYGFHQASVEDATEPDHLPKYENFRNYGFVIFRFFSMSSNHEADTVQELTDKISIFYSDKFVVTVHQKEWPHFEDVSQKFVAAGDCQGSIHLFQEIVRYGLLTFDAPLDALGKKIDTLEERVFLKNKNIPILKRLYYVKRKIDVLKRLLLLTNDIIDHIDPPESSNEYTRDIRDLYVKQQSLFDSVADNTTHLLAIYFNISSQRTNETIRVLTIFSVFFMPLTFIVGIYGMNFDFMPELHQRWGYPGVMILMAVIVIGIYIWFRQKKWL